MIIEHLLKKYSVPRTLLLLSVLPFLSSFRRNFFPLTTTQRKANFAVAMASISDHTHVQARYFEG
jgi:hypothetical protein